MSHPLTIWEQADITVQQDMVTFMENAEERLRAKLTCDELEELGIPDNVGYVPYADGDWNKMTFPDLNEEVTPQVGNEYVHASVMFPLKSQMMKGTVKACKQNQDGNHIGCWLDNPILVMHLCDVGFLYGEMIPLTANIIAQAMYTQRDVDENEYLLLKCFVDIQKDPTAISLDDQKAVYNGQEYMHCTTLGWHICCQRKDGPMSWEKLLDVK